MNHLQPTQPCLGWVCVVVFCRVGARNSSAILHCSRQVNRWPRYSVISRCKHELEKIKENYYPVRLSIKRCSVQLEQSSLHAERCWTVKPNLHLLKSTVFQLHRKRQKPIASVSLPSLGLHPTEKGWKHHWGAGNLPGFLLLSGSFPA